jgi:CBS domain containing-hemolysin-like protein
MSLAFFQLLLSRLRRWADQWRRLRRAMALVHHADDLHDAFADRPNRALTQHERDLLENALAFSARTARQVGVARAEIIALPIGATLTETLKHFGESAHSRLPVIGQNLDDVRGVVSLKDVVTFIGHSKNFALTDLLQPALLLPEAMPLTKVLQHMRQDRMPLALVTDEFGGVSGLVGLKDILIELVGDLAPNEDEAGPGIMSLGGGVFRVRGSTSLNDVDAMLSLTLSRHFANVETLAGAVLQTAQHLPPTGSTVALPGVAKVVVQAADARRIVWLEVHLA